MDASRDLLFMTLGDPTRRGLFERLASGSELTVAELTQTAGISQPAVSKHLNVLKLAGLVRERPEGRRVYYSADPKGLRPLFDWVRFYTSFWDQRLDRLEDLLRRMDP
jgi:DNA-binding transcriptional ArsR family regulator